MTHPHARRGKSITEAEFRRLWLDNSITRAEIAKRLGIGEAAARSRAIRRGLPARPGFHAKLRNWAITADVLLPLWQAMVTTEGIAKHLGVPDKAIHQAAVRLGLPPRNSSRWKCITLEQYLAGVAEKVAEKRARDEAEFAAMWRAGVSASDLAAHLGVNRSNVYARASRNGLKRCGPKISLAEYLQQQLARRLARAAHDTREAMLGRDMVDSAQCGQWHKQKRAA